MRARRSELTGVLAAIGLSVVAGVVVASPLVTVAGPLLVVLAGVERGRRRRRRWEVARAEALPMVVDQLVQQLRSGASLRQACVSLAGAPPERSANPHRGEESGSPFRSISPPTSTSPPASTSPLAPLTRALAKGSTLAGAAGALTVDGDPSVRLVGVTLQVLAENGGPAVPALQRLRHTLMGRLHHRHRAEAQAAQAMASAGLLALAPVLFAGLLATVEPAIGAFYLRDPLGALCGTAALGLSGGGWWWMQRVVGRIEREAA